MKDNHIIIFLFILIIVGFESCIDELNIEVEDVKNILVVEGFITSENGPHKIKLS